MIANEEVKVMTSSPITEGDSLNLFYLLLLIILLCPSSYAGRPLITDDADVVGEHTFQLESWLFADESSLQHWIVPAFGIGDSVELSISGVHGLSSESVKQEYSLSGPIVQTKILLMPIKPQKHPGLALSGAFLPPFGEGEFKAPVMEYFFYGALSSSFLEDDRLLLHVNLGAQSRRQLEDSSAVLWGVAGEVKVMKDTYGFVEASNGEVYAIIPGIASQIGFRTDVNDHLQIDATMGTGLTGDPRLPFWTTIGFKYAGDI